MKLIQLSFVLVSICSLVGNVFGADDWWENGHFYQIYPRSFKDSDGDGLGDLNGITSKLAHLKEIDVTGIWLSPIFESPMRDMGYDISDFRKIHREFGTMADFDSLLAECKKLGIQLILDFVPNHTSDQHEWFKKSADPSDPDHEKYKDFYIWHKGKLLSNGTRIPPSNWVSIFGGSMWTWASSRKAFFMHQFLKEQPDLNFRNQMVQKEMKKVLRFWLRKGVSGFRIDAVPHLFEVRENSDGMYDDEPKSGQCDNTELYCYHTHTKTTHLDETFELIYQWRSVMDEMEFVNHTRILMTEAYGTVPIMARYYGRVNENGVVVKYGAQIPFNFQLMSVRKESKADEYMNDINAWMKAMPKGNGIQANWVLGNHDGSRLASRYGTNREKAYNILIKTLPGITVTYYGEEIGMVDVDVSSVDKDDRSRCRTPFQWDNTTNAGFSTNPKTWLPVAPDYATNNVLRQKQVGNSSLSVFQKLMKLRQDPSLKYGGLEVKTTKNNEILMYKREIKNIPCAGPVIVVMNLSESMYGVYLRQYFLDVPDEVEILISSHSSDREGKKFNTSGFNILPNEAIVLGTVQNRSRINS